MIDRMLLLADLRKLRAELEGDLGAQATNPDIETALRSQHRASIKAKNTDASYTAWVSDQVTKAAVSWVLDTVFLRFCEDNGLVDEPHLADPNDGDGLTRDRHMTFLEERPTATDRDWLIHGFDHLCTESSVMVDILNTRSGGLLPSLTVSPEAARKVVEFWRTRDEGGDLIYTFNEPLSDTGGWDTRFLGDLYQDLSEHQRKVDALVQTPDFVAEFILDQTLEPAIATIGLPSLRTIDPVCGSGHFVLSMFQRLFDHWRRLEPELPPWLLVERALRSVHGVDKNSNAVSITRFRLLVAAMSAAGARRLADIPDLRIAIATGDSLLAGEDPQRHQISNPEGRLVDQGVARNSVGSFSDIELLQTGSYDVVVGNPPYTTPHSRLIDEAYRTRFPDVCTGRYALPVPFIVRFFDLARRDGRDSGFVGLLSANSFMKRDFGRHLVERFFPTVDITQIIDTSGAYIPGHGTPTVLLFGRNQPPSQSLVPAVICLRGESQWPADPSKGRVWQSTLSTVRCAGYADSWTERVALDRSVLQTFPWKLTDAASAAVLRKMEGVTDTENRMKLKDRVRRIGYFANTGSDEAFVASEAAFQRSRAEQEFLIPILRGSDIRDWTARPSHQAALLPSPSRISDVGDFPNLMRRLWPYRTVLRHNRDPWYTWHHVSEVRNAHPWRIAFTWVSTHNHFVILRDRIAPLTSAPIIELPHTASNSDVLQLAALLNSSLACFWLKHHCNSKGQPGIDQIGIGEPWSVFYEFAGNRLRELPLPRGQWFQDRWTIYSEVLDELVREIEDTDPRSTLRHDTLPTSAELDAARTRWTKARGRLVGLQEELDWEIYERYGLTNDTDQLRGPIDAVPELKPGERAFEIVLARRMARGETDSKWFERNGIAPITSVPHHWPHAYRETIERRIVFIETRQNIRRVEQPEYKRRWHSPDWDTLLHDALEAWILDRMEKPALWFGNEDDQPRQPRLRTLTELLQALSSDDDLIRAVSLLDSSASVTEVLRNLIEAEHVPFLAALRYRPSGCRKFEAWQRTWHDQRAEDTTSGAEHDARQSHPLPPKYTSADFLKQSYWLARGKLDVPNERFVSYPIDSPVPELYGWAGWDYEQRAVALAEHIRHLTSSNTTKSHLIPLLAGLLELEPWIRQWHPDRCQDVVDFRISVQDQCGIKEDDLAAWQPAAPKRGRPRKIFSQ
ncbi:BREX-2 system adenine-specific DNA-methyltransferase PglX [Nocardia sp. NPDC047038]|uniref:BREX-2 system adenine-specific DNA-methyltransferase PglX n=1 Tax=Nocardia sp. NPDC047038 TaxID=3154338 RepID=UPI0033F64B60